MSSELHIIPIHRGVLMTMDYDDNLGSVGRLVANNNASTKVNKVRDSYFVSKQRRVSVRIYGQVSDIMPRTIDFGVPFKVFLLDR